jgi:hypothetical protein
MDRKFHCSRVCSGNAASRAYRDRKKLKKAKRLIAAGRSVKKAAELTKIDAAWLKSMLEKGKPAGHILDTSARNKVSSSP